MLNLYITSPNKNNGKTFLSTGLAVTMQSLGYSTSVYKPVQAGGIEINGFMQSPELTIIKTMDPYINTGFSYLFKSKTVPFIASEDENIPIDFGTILKDYKSIISTSDCTIIDSEGGLLTPLSATLQNVDIVTRLQVPLLFVITPSEEEIDSALLSLNLAQEKGLLIRGVVINNISEDCSKKTLTSITRIIEEYSNAKILGLISQLKGKITPEDLITLIINGIDIESIFDVKIEKLDLG